jgi:hypothetical protein
MHLAPALQILATYTTAYEQGRRPGTTAQKGKAIAGGVTRNVMMLNPLTDPTFQQDGMLSPERFGRTASGFVPGLNIGLLRELGEVVDDKSRSTYKQGVMGPVYQQIPPGLGIGRENLPESNHPLGGRGGMGRRALRLLFEPPRGGSEVRPQSALPLTPLRKKKK